VLRPETDRQRRAAAVRLRTKFIDNPDRDDPRWALFALALTGLRQAERLGLRVQDIDFDDPDNPVLLIHQQLDFRKQRGGWYLKDITKNGEPREVPIWGVFLEVVQRQLLWRAQWQAEAGESWNPPTGFEDLLFLQPKGALWTRRQDTPAWRKFVVPEMRPHLARHATAILLAEDGISMETAKTLLGHKSDAWATYYRIASTRQAHQELTRADQARRTTSTLRYEP
jgi:integrase